MKPERVIPFVLVVLFMAAGLNASIRDLQIYGIVERVAFEPNEKSPERIKVWGAFALLYTNQEPVRQGDGPYSPHRGYLYFKLPPVDRGDTKKLAQESARKEWADLKSVAGTGQAIIFGSWTSSYFGLTRNSKRNGFVSAAYPEEALVVYTESERSGSPITYTMDTGIAKIHSEGRYGPLVAQLKQALLR